MRTEYYKGLDRIIAKARRERKMREAKELAVNVTKALACAVLGYGVIFLGWTTLCAMFPTW